jgi:hypothetical protein
MDVSMQLKMGPQVARLKSFLRQEVKIKGILRTKEGKKIIKVKKFSKLKNQV